MSFEKTFLELWGYLFQSDSLQFGYNLYYKHGASMTQCTWLVQEVVQHYLCSSCHPIIAIAVLDCS